MILSSFILLSRTGFRNQTLGFFGKWNLLVEPELELADYSLTEGQKVIIGLAIDTWLEMAAFVLAGEL